MELKKYDALLLFPQIGVCGQNCKHCFTNDKLKENRPFEDVKYIIDAMAETLAEPAITEKAFLYFLDEMTLYPQVIELLSYCREKNVLPQPCLVTNGSGIAARQNGEEILEELKKCGVNGLMITIFGDEKYHDWFTGRKGSFQECIKATRMANAHGFWVAWNMYLTNENVDQLVKVARMKGDSKCRFMVPYKSDNWQKWSHIHADIDAFSKIPEDCRGFVKYDFRSEGEWVEMILNGELDSEKKDSGEEKVRYKVLHEIGGVLYKGSVISPEYVVGHIENDSLRDVFLSDKKPPGMIVSEQVDLKELATKYGDPSSRKAMMLSHLEIEWGE